MKKHRAGFARCFLLFLHFLQFLFFLRQIVMQGEIINIDFTVFLLILFYIQKLRECIFSFKAIPPECCTAKPVFANQAHLDRKSVV